MKSERGVTLTSILIYVIALTVIVLIIGRIITYFYKNMNDYTGEDQALSEYIKINSYLTNEINTKGNIVEAFGENYLKFSKTQNQYTYQNGKIYINKAKICDDVDNCKFSYDETKEKVSMEITIKGKTYYNTYIIIK